jgi:condensin-2 complex subunit H2
MLLFLKTKSQSHILLSYTDTSNPDAVAFEELCRAHIRAFAKGAENYRAETNLTKRVGDWQSKLAPILEEEAARPEFDIHVYGEHVINTIKKNTDHGGAVKGDKTNHRTHFSSVTQAKKHYDVCRLFLASLSLVNGGNVKFNADEGRVMAPDTLVIELLNSSVDRPMETYLAPSALEGRSKIII